MTYHCLVLILALSCQPAGEEIPLDTRIKADRITILAKPEPAAARQIPFPPCHRIATDPANMAIPEEEAVLFRQAMSQGVKWLLEHQDTNGGWGGGATAKPTTQPDGWASPAAAAITGLGLKAVAQSGAPTASLEPAISRLERATRGDFGFENDPLANYIIAAVASGLASLDDPAYQETIATGVELLRKNQWDGQEGLLIEQDWYGGAGYGNRGRPDLSNTQVMLDALHDAGVSSNDETFQRAVVFLSRCQNRQASNSAEWCGNDGGFVYTAANGGESLASEVAGHGRHGNENLNGTARSLRSYGSMTYAGYKSMLYAGLQSDDPRVGAAMDWLRNNWSTTENPGLGQQGFFYYVYTMSRALYASGLNEITETDGETHDWRLELGQALIARQSKDGYWVNPASRWLEGRKDLATIYAVLALEEILKPTPHAMVSSPTQQGIK